MMKTFFKLAFLFYVSLFTDLAYALQADYAAYMRGGAGTNQLGGKQECFANPGISVSNFLRLGNECSFYTELAMVFHHMKPSEQEPLYFDTQLRFQYSADGVRQWESKTARDVNQLEAYVKAGGFQEFPGSIWIGKRFYRDVDVHIFDWYYYADMSGIGAGVDDIKTGAGELAFAHLLQAEENVNNTSVGRPLLQALDLRWKNIELSPSHRLNFWGVYAWAPANTNGAVEHVKTDGYSLSTRLQSAVGGGHNQLSLMYGKGAMKGFNIYGDILVPVNADEQNRAWTYRVVNDWHMDVSKKWGLMFALAAEKADTGAVVDSHKDWYAVGLRPIYFVSDRVQMVFEAGLTGVRMESDRNLAWESLGERRLARVTFAPQISLSKSIWGRPVMRAFVAHTVWNEANKGQVGNPTFADRTEGTNVGYQFEVWF